MKLRLAGAPALMALSLLAACSGPDERVEPPVQLNAAPAIAATFGNRLLELKEPFEVYRAENGRYPEGSTVQSVLEAGIAAPAEDPWGNAVTYEGSASHYRFSSAGPDRAWGTADDIAMEDGHLVAGGGK